MVLPCCYRSKTPAKPALCTYCTSSCHSSHLHTAPLHSCTTNVTTATEETLTKSGNQSYQQQCERTCFQTDYSTTSL